MQIAYAMRFALLADDVDACGGSLSDTTRFEQSVEDIVGQAYLVDNTMLMVSLVFVKLFNFFDLFSINLLV